MTRGTDTRPTRRLLSGDLTDYVVRLGGRSIYVRPKGAREKGPSEVEITAGQLYTRLMMARADERRRAKRRKGAR